LLLRWLRVLLRRVLRVLLRRSLLLRLRPRRGLLRVLMRRLMRVLRRWRLRRPRVTRLQILLLHVPTPRLPRGLLMLPVGVPGRWRRRRRPGGRHRSGRLTGRGGLLRVLGPPLPPEELHRHTSSIASRKPSGFSTTSSAWPEAIALPDSTTLLVSAVKNLAMESPSCDPGREMKANSD
jgi:hypothetical protein